ncbi:hypothetical protein AB0B28_05870 [Glycomyces sp. NPDC046736]|uniref:hypothetical protein n=1 Tax=Glycomyces sp. NPDC046736 TaxID=3155615 RepID=UPI0033F9F679
MVGTVEIERVAACALAVQRSALLPQEEQAALLDRYRRLRERVLREGSAEDLLRLAQIDDALGPVPSPVTRTLRSRLVQP